MQKSLIVEFGFKKGKKNEAEYSLLKIFVFRRSSWSSKNLKISSLSRVNKGKKFLLGDIHGVNISANLQVVSYDVDQGCARVTGVECVNFIEMFVRFNMRIKYCYVL